MDASMNNYDNYDDEIRPPDEVKKEQLIPNFDTNDDRELEEVLYLSMQEALDQEKNFKIMKIKLFLTILMKLKYVERNLVNYY